MQRKRPRCCAAVLQRRIKQRAGIRALLQQHGGDGDRSDGDVELKSRSASECKASSPAAALLFCSEALISAQEYARYHQQHGGDGDGSDGDVELMSRSASECRVTK